MHTWFDAQIDQKILDDIYWISSVQKQVESDTHEIHLACKILTGTFNAIVQVSIQRDIPKILVHWYDTGLCFRFWVECKEPAARMVAYFSFGSI